MRGWGCESPNVCALTPDGTDVARTAPIKVKKP
jgi:hypothetical protein